jgi:hypothetical protein
MKLVTIQVWIELDAHPRISAAKVAAIRTWCKATGCGLKEAKDFVEDCHAVERAVSVRLTAEQLGMFVALIGQTHHDQGLTGFDQFMGIRLLTARVLDSAEYDFSGAGG